MGNFPNVVDYIDFPGPALTVVCFELDWNDASGTYKIPIEAGGIVRDVATVVTTAFDGTNPTLNISDSDSATTYYLTNANIALATAATTTSPAVKTATVTGSANGYANGKYYGAAGSVNLVWVAATATPTAGRLLGYLLKTNFNTQCGAATGN